MPRDTTRYLKVIPLSSTKIWCIEDEYTDDEADRRRAASTYSTLEVDVEMLLTDASAPTPTSRPKGTSAPSSSSQDPGDSSSSQPIKIT